MADVAAVGSVLVPAARRSRQNPGNAVALLAASAVMAEAIPPCINLIIRLVANLSIGGLFMAGLVPAAVALALIAVAVVFGTRTLVADETTAKVPTAQLWSGAAATVGLLVLIFGGFQSGFATRRKFRRSRRSTRWWSAASCFASLAGKRRAQLHALGDPVRADHVHRGGGAIARLRADPAANPARARRCAGSPVADQRHLAVHDPVDRDPDRDGLGAGKGRPP